jgi:hypothetical protein
MAQILTYPYGIKYKTSGWANQVKQGTGGSIPCNNEVKAGTQILQDSNSGQWWGDYAGDLSCNFGQANSDPFNQTWGGTDQRGAHYFVNSKSNQTWDKWFDIGAEGGKNSGDYMNGGARSSWLREVTAIWFLFHGHTTYESQGCYAKVAKVGLRYRDPNGKIQIYECTEKLGNLGLRELVRGSSKHMFGYAIPSSKRSTICRNNYRFLGPRIQIQLQKTDGIQVRTICGGCTGLRFGLGETPIGSYNETAKRALVLSGNTTWNDFNNSSIKDRLETR